jgi:3-oxoacyl-[acyl-carrier-protein] synthase II
MPPNPATRRVVVTGLGTVNPLGNNVPSSWDRLLTGESAVDWVPEFVDAGLPVQIGATVSSDFDPAPFLSNSRAESVRFVALAMAAATEALADAGWSPQTDHDRNRTGVALGAGIGSLDEITGAFETLDRGGGLRRLTPYFIPRTLVNMAAGNVSLKWGLRGPNHCAVTACATGAHAIGDASRFIRFNDCDVMVAGGTESTMNALAIAGFSRVKALAPHDGWGGDEGVRSASRPFDTRRAGFVMGEGAGVVVLEELEHALRRGAKIYGEIRGYGLSGDAHHITAPAKDGDGAYRAMQSAMAQAGLLPEHVGYVNAHATSTPLGDIVEANAIRRLFGDHAPRVSSTKGATGHLLGAAGAVEAIFSILALQQGQFPPTTNCVDVDASVQGVRVIPASEGVVVDTKVDAVLSNSFGFGGTNCSLCFAKYKE